MDTGERLAAYLSGDLDPDERTALEAELAGDAVLQARLERIRRADEAVAGLPEVDLPEGFTDRLHHRLRPELDAVLGDQLAARRARRTTPRWLPALGAAAALVVVVAGGIAVTGGMGGSDDSADDAGGDRMLAEAGTAEETASEQAAEDSLEAMSAPATLPLLVDLGRTVTDDDLEALAQDPDVQAALTDATVLADPGRAATEFGKAYDIADGDLSDDRTEAADEETAASDADGTGDAGGTAPAPSAATALTVRGDVSQEDREAVAACLPRLSDGAAAPVVPVYAEVADDEDGNAVVVFAALSPDTDGNYERLEVWVFDRDTCEPRLFLQSEAQPVDRNAP